MIGVYVLVLELKKDTDVQIGKLGKLPLGKGYYAYVGSAMGPGGFKRVTRHFEVASGKNPSRKWHIDYLLAHSRAVCAVLLPSDNAIECTAAKSIGVYFRGISGFGCSDCSCTTHLFFAGKNPVDEIARICNKLIEKESIIITPYM